MAAVAFGQAARHHARYTKHTLQNSPNCDESVSLQQQRRAGPPHHPDLCSRATVLPHTTIVSPESDSSVCRCCSGFRAGPPYHPRLRRRAPQGGRRIDGGAIAARGAPAEAARLQVRIRTSKSRVSPLFEAYGFPVENQCPSTQFATTQSATSMLLCADVMGLPTAV